MPKSPSLEVISAKGDRTERRRMPRLQLAAEQFRDSRNGKIYSVADLSRSGLALRVLDEGDLALFPVASVFSGSLNLRREKHPVRVRVCNVARGRVGCEFLEVEGPVAKALEAYLEPSVLGHELRPLPSSERGTIWYHGPSGTDLILWRGSAGRFRRLALVVLGLWVHWDEETGLCTGAVRETRDDGETRGVIRFETLIVDRDERPDGGKLHVAKTVLLSSNLPEDLKRWSAVQLGLD